MLESICYFKFFINYQELFEDFSFEFGGCQVQRMIWTQLRSAYMKFFNVEFSLLNHNQQHQHHVLDPKPTALSTYTILNITQHHNQYSTMEKENKINLHIHIYNFCQVNVLFLVIWCWYLIDIWQMSHVETYLYHIVSC